MAIVPNNKRVGFAGSANRGASAPKGKYPMLEKLIESSGALRQPTAAAEQKCWGCGGTGETQNGEFMVGGESVGSYEPCSMCDGTGKESGRFIQPVNSSLPEPSAPSADLMAAQPEKQIDDDSYQAGFKDAMDQGELVKLRDKNRAKALQIEALKREVAFLRKAVKKEYVVQTSCPSDLMAAVREVVVEYEKVRKSHFAPHPRSFYDSLSRLTACAEKAE